MLHINKIIHRSYNYINIRSISNNIKTELNTYREKQNELINNINQYTINRKTIDNNKNNTNNNNFNGRKINKKNNKINEDKENVTKINQNIDKKTILKGIVIKTCNDKTIAVRVPKLSIHPLINKPIMKHVRYQVHDEFEKCVIGDIINIIPSEKSYSKFKKHELYQIIKPAIQYKDEIDGQLYTQKPNYNPDKYVISRTKAGINVPLSIN